MMGRYEAKGDSHEIFLYSILAMCSCSTKGVSKLNNVETEAEEGVGRLRRGSMNRNDRSDR